MSERTLIVSSRGCSLAGCFRGGVVCHPARCHFTHQRLASQPLRRKKSVGVIQELYGLLIAHYAVRKVMPEATTEVGLDPDRMSFINSLELIFDAVPEFQMTELVLKFRRRRCNASERAHRSGRAGSLYDHSETCWGVPSGVGARPVRLHSSGACAQPGVSGDRTDGRAGRGARRGGGGRPISQPLPER